MVGQPRNAGGEEPVERFKPSTGVFTGWTGVALAVLTVGYVAVDLRTSAGLTIALGAAFAGVLIWTTQLRPRVTAYSNRLVVHGPVRDTIVPLALVQEVSMGQTLNIRAGGHRYVCVGIGKPVGFEVRQRMRAHGQGGGQLGANRVTQVTPQTEREEVGQPSISYPDFVLNRIRDLVAIARPRTRGTEPDQAPQVRQAYAVPELVALAVLGAAFLVSVVLL